MRTIAAALVGLFLTGCAGVGPGHYYDIQFVGSEDTCHNALKNYNGTEEYRLVRDGNSATLYIGEDVLGTGSINNCVLTYRSAAYTEVRGENKEYSVRYSISGTAEVDSGDGCSAGKGWRGEERYDVLESNDPSVPAGCTYVMEANGTYLGEQK